MGYRHKEITLFAIMGVLILSAFSVGQEAKAQTTGPVLISTSDPCFHTNGQTGAINFIENVAFYMTSQTGNNILLLGDNNGHTQNVLTNSGFSVTTGSVDTISFAGFDVIIVDAGQLCGLEPISYYNDLLSRTADFTAHVNGGGALAVFYPTSEFLAGGFTPDFIQGIGSFTFDGNDLDAYAINPISQSHPIFTTPNFLTVFDLIWGNFAHGHILTYPPNFQNFVISTSGDSALVFSEANSQCDVNQCQANGDSSAICDVNTNECVCGAGYENDGTSCVNFNACDADPCFPSVMCTDLSPPDTGFICGACPSGYTGDGITCTDINECADNICDPNALCTNQPGSFTCECQDGFVGDGFTCVPDNLECTPGQFENSGICELCPAGTYQPASGQTSCFDADPGHFVSSAGSTEQTQCPSGTFSTNTGSVECIPCEAGFYQPAAGQQQCIPSEPGHFVSNTGSNSQQECSAGEFSSDAGSTQCFSCTAGTYQQSIGQSQCIPSEPGHFVSTQGSDNQNECPEGTIQSQSGQTSCLACPAGEISNHQRTECIVAPPNVMCGVGTILNDDNKCVPDFENLCGPGTILDVDLQQCVVAPTQPEPVNIDGRLVGKHSSGTFETSGSLTIDGEKFKRVKSIGTFQIQDDGEKCSPLTGQGAFDLKNDNEILFDLSGDICQDRFLAKGDIQFIVTGGQGVFEDSEGSGDISLIIGKKHFAGKLSGDIVLKGSKINEN